MIDVYPLPWFEKVIKCLENLKYFLTLVLMNKYWQVPLVLDLMSF